MLIGIDFDNTIACYDEAFAAVAREEGLLADIAADKRAVREAVRALEQGEYQWQRLQGLVYGRLILRARPFPGVREFFDAAHSAGVELVIVSHKTELAHHDPLKTDLRVAARGFLAHHGFSGTQAFFEPTREEKLARITALGCDAFIDDLPEVLLDPAFPPACRGYYFSPLPHPGLEPVATWGALQKALLP